MRRKILVADLLCGAGGSSTGCAHALAELGLQMELVCVNHWPIAIETHRRNHPDARHYVQDIATVRPHLIVPEGYLDLLMASPTCTHHSVARGGKPTSDQQRSDPWHIITWLTELRVKRIIIENVWEFIGWGPVDHRTAKPIAQRKGEYFRAWIDTIRRLGFEPEWHKLNAADFGDATTRQRFILMARSDKRAVSWPMPTHRRKPDGELALLPSVKPWRPAREIIDWSLKGKSIFSRKKPLAPKTLARIHAGAVKFGWPEPFLVILRNHMAGQSVDGPLPTIAAGGTHIALAEPIIFGNRSNNAAKSAGEPVPCLTTAHGGGIAIAEPFVLSPQNSAPRAASEPLPTITTGGAGVETHPGCARPMLVEPFVISPRHGRKGAGPQPREIAQPLPTITAGGSQVAIVEPFVMSRQGGGAPRPVDEPTPTQTAKHSHLLIAPYYGSGSGESCQTAEEPLPTVTAKGRFGMVVPITHAGADDHRARDLSDPLPTITTAHRGEFAFIEPTPDCAMERYDILFRMLEPHELAAAMGFSSEEASYQFAGTKTEQIKQIGNAVSVRKMRACVAALMADAAPKRARKPSSAAAITPIVEAA